MVVRAPKEPFSHCLLLFCLFVVYLYVSVK